MSWVINSSGVGLYCCRVIPPHPSQSGASRVWWFNSDIMTLVTDWRQSWLSSVCVCQSETCRDPTDWLERSGVGAWLTTWEVLGEGVLRDPKVSTVSSHPDVEDSDGAELSSFSWSVNISTVLVGFCSRLVSVRCLNGSLGVEGEDLTSLGATNTDWPGVGSALLSCQSARLWSTDRISMGLWAGSVWSGAPLGFVPL